MGKQIELRDTGKYLVYLYWFSNNSIDPIGFTDSEEEARAYIKQEMEGKQYSGMAVYNIKPLGHIYDRKKDYEVMTMDILHDLVIAVNQSSEIKEIYKDTQEEWVFINLCYHYILNCGTPAGDETCKLFERDENGYDLIIAVVPSHLDIPMYGIYNFNTSDIYTSLRPGLSDLILSEWKLSESGKKFILKWLI